MEYFYVVLGRKTNFMSYFNVKFYGQVRTTTQEDQTLEEFQGALDEEAKADAMTSSAIKGNAKPMHLPEEKMECKK